MSHQHLHLSTQLSQALRLDGGAVAGPVPRWQKKARDKGLTIMPNSSENSLAGSFSGSPHSGSPFIISHDLSNHNSSSADFVGAIGNSKSPARGGRGSNNNSLLMPCTLGNRSLNSSGLQPRTKSPARTVMMPRAKTPTRLTPNTPLLGTIGDQGYPGDRFIPVRPTEMQADRSHHLVMKQIREMEGTDLPEEELTQQQLEHRTKMMENLNNGQPIDDRIVHFSKKAPSVPGNANSKVLFSATKSSSKVSSTRHIPNVPDRVLDAPELTDDYYLHLIDWSANNHVVVALAGTVYLWNAGDGSIVSLTTIEPPEYVCSLKWTHDGSVLAVGTSEKEIQLWDTTQQKRIRTMAGQHGRVASLAWSGNNLSSGGRTGLIVHHDVRIQNHVTNTINAHNQEVCGLAWNSNQRTLASGGNDNIVHIWDGRNSGTAVHTMPDHQAAVKAVSWCPWQNNLLSTGGGTADRTIRVWNSNTGTCVKQVLTESQVSAIVWNASYKELITGHGFTHNQLTIWKYPNFTKVSELTGHTGRVLEMVASPDGEMVASAAADETIRLWKVWPLLAKEKKQSRGLQPSSALSRCIR